MQYLLMIYTNEKEDAALGQVAHGKIVQEYSDYTKSIVQAGHFKGAERLSK